MAAGSLPTLSVRNDLSSATIAKRHNRSFGRLVDRAASNTLPGASAHFRFSSTARGRRFESTRFRASPWTTTTPKKARLRACWWSSIPHQTSPWKITTRCSPMRGPGHAGKRVSLVAHIGARSPSLRSLRLVRAARRTATRTALNTSLRTERPAGPSVRPSRRPRPESMPRFSYHWSDRAEAPWGRRSFCGRLWTPANPRLYVSRNLDVLGASTLTVSRPSSSRGKRVSTFATTTPPAEEPARGSPVAPSLTGSHRSAMPVAELPQSPGHPAPRRSEGSHRGVQLDDGPAVAAGSTCAGPAGQLRRDHGPRALSSEGAVAPAHVSDMALDAN